MSTFSASSTAIALTTDAEGGVDDATSSSSASSASSSAATRGAMTVDEAIERIGLGPFQYFLVAVAGMALIGDASEMMLLSFLGPIVQCFFGVDDPEKEAVLTTIVFVGMSVGGLSFGALADRVGRRVGLLATALFCSVGGVASALSATFGVLLFFRFCVGVGLGGVAVACSYALEFIPAKNRGKAGVLLQSFWTVGTLIQAILTWVSFNALGWRWVVALSAIPIFILLLLFSKLPESPRYLALKGDHVKCKDTLCKMAARNGTMSRLPHESDLTIKTRSVHAERTVLQNYQEAFSKGFRRDTILLLIIWFANAFVYYGLVLLTTELALVRERVGVAGVAGVAADSGNAASASASNRSSTPASHHGLDCAHLFSDSFFGEIFIATIAEMPGLVLSVFLVDRLGRKRTQSLFFLAVTLPMIILALVPRSAGGDTFLLFLSRGSSMGAFTTVYIYTPERYPTRFRNTAMGLCFGVARIGGMIAPLVGQDLPERGMTGAAFAIFITVSIVACVSTCLLTTETNGRDADHPVAAGRVGRAAAALTTADSHAEMRKLPLS